MTVKRESEILNAWAMFEDAEPDISTELLLQQVADFCGCEDVGEVVDALAARERRKGRADA